MGDTAVCSPRRVTRPAHRRYVPPITERRDTWLRLLSKIESSYTEARDRLAVRARPVTLARLLDAGLCIGLLDPASNIMANAICTSDRWPADHGSEAVLSGALVDEKLRDMGIRSLRGLIAFLVYFFPYLDEWEAVRYLLLADADLLAAVRLVLADRGMLARFSLGSPVSAPACEEALTVAAQMANHPEPEHLVRVWMMLSSRLHQALRLLSDVQCHSPINALERFRSVLDDNSVPVAVVPSLAVPWDLAAHRHELQLQCDSSSISVGANMPCQHTRTLRNVLLDTIHCFYLQALAMLPRDELRSHLHRSLLRAGYCYGPLDPVSNIIYNTIWYHANFPAAVTPTLDVIAPESLARVQTRSLYGLVSFLQTRYHDLSEHLALRCIATAFGQPSLSDPITLMSESDKSQVEHRQPCSPNDLGLFHMFGLDDVIVENVGQKSSCATTREAYMAAAISGWHRNPEELATFLASWSGLPVVRNQLTSEDVRRWTDHLSPKHPPTPERICSSFYNARDGKGRCMDQQRRIFRKVKAALERHLLHDGEPAYDLHIIACVNEDVCGPEYCEDVPASLSLPPYKYRYTHVNFLATRKGSLSSASNPMLFFAEFDNDENEDSATLLCCPVDKPKPFAAHVRCLYCEVSGARVVHPTSMEFHGGGSELAKMVRRENSLCIASLISENDYAVKRMGALEEDYLYVEVKKRSSNPVAAGRE